MEGGEKGRKGGKKTSGSVGGRKMEGGGVRVGRRLEGRHRS